VPLPRVQMDGRLTADPELRFTPQGHAVANFTVAGNDRKKDDATGEWSDGPATFLRCSVWREQAENVAESLRKGDAVLVTGKVTQREYDDKEGRKVTAYEVQVETIGPSLRWRATPHGQQKRTERTQEAPQEDAWASVPRVPQARVAGPEGAPRQAVQPVQPPVQQPAWAGRPPAYDEPPF
jgi:single-strand DNA-binding protein